MYFKSLQNIYAGVLNESGPLLRYVEYHVMSVLSFVRLNQISLIFICLICSYEKIAAILKVVYFHVLWSVYVAFAVYRTYPSIVPILQSINLFVTQNISPLSFYLVVVRPVSNTRILLKPALPLSFSIID